MAGSSNRPKRVPKTETETVTVVKNRNGNIVCTYRMSSGGIDYYRKNAKVATASYTWQQLANLMEEQ